MWGKYISVREKSKWQTEAGKYLASSRQSEEAIVTGVEWMKAGVAEDMVRGK